MMKIPPFLKSSPALSIYCQIKLKNLFLDYGVFHVYIGNLILTHVIKGFNFQDKSLSSFS